MTALAFDFDFGPNDEVAPAADPRRRLYAVRGTVDARAATPAATAVAPAAPSAVSTALRAAATPSLDVILGGAWEALAVGRPADCPVCASALRPRWSAGSAVAAARCDGCGSTLS